MNLDEPDARPAVDLAAEARGPLASLYRELDRAVAQLGPACALSGRCCRFEEYDHTLFLSAPEAAVLIVDGPDPVRPLDEGATCPWQDERGRCTAREARPLGCRVYFCDPSYEGQAPILTERFLGRLKALVEELGWPWAYAPLHTHLRAASERGELVTPLPIGAGPPAPGAAIEAASPPSETPA